jgi:hypothetical protein
MSEAIGSVLTSRMASIELERVNTNTRSIELAHSRTQAAASPIYIPESIDALIDNKMYRNKFKKLIREGHLNDLLQLAKMARGKDNPSHWFATVTATKSKDGKPPRWEGTLKFLSELRRVRQTAAEVLRRVQVPAGSLTAVYKACWKLKEAVVQRAVTAAEIGRDPFRLFCWLCYSSAGIQPRA